MRFAPGQTVLRRYFVDGKISFLNVGRVEADDELGLRMWIPIGAPFWRRLTVDGRDGHTATVEELADAELGELTWTGSHVLVYMPPGPASSVWWFFDPDGEFAGWYVNLEDPYARWAGGVDTADHALDLVVGRDRSWRWKDEDEFAERTGHPLYWTAEQAAAIRAEGERLAGLAEAGAFPFDGAWCDLRPDPGWPPLTRPAGWDVPRTDTVRP
jgi:Protein of unknown function (DUF402)